MNIGATVTNHDEFQFGHISELILTPMDSDRIAALSHDLCTRLETLDRADLEWFAGAAVANLYSLHCWWHTETCCDTVNCALASWAEFIQFIHTPLENL